ncbi:hypothetical protein K493DRAFT_333217 [Basidiobolus meristosporus CBS 931.73]|uniref:Uncharacterized protein n=1 Tax=Basidiobolus meristosporus CBS 931.73 TaxID=1314790 RepID=A0A1Y1Z805_9FUNG|nr:hypothetical protein K493DRAFT_333217 [Basidiobolus meristosporus CBS 931.73]|eukprot:ORY06336.1 hypothetical protein K493DRAFT_333217 [Basidiobolus meristosporus CBS 931.73]
MNLQLVQTFPNSNNKPQPAFSIVTIDPKIGYFEWEVSHMIPSGSNYTLGGGSAGGASYGVPFNVINTSSLPKHHPHVKKQLVNTNNSTNTQGNSTTTTNAATTHRNTGNSGDVSKHFYLVTFIVVFVTWI